MKVKKHQLLLYSLFLYCFVSLLSYPFVPLKYIHHSAFQLLSLLILISIILIALLISKHQIHIEVKRVINSNFTLVIFLFFYIIYILILGLSSLNVNDSPIYFTNYIKILIKFSIALGLLYFVPLTWFRIGIRHYSKAIAILSLMAIILFIFIYYDIASPNINIYLPGEHYNIFIRKLYSLGSIWPMQHLPIGGGIFRLQSFADEPGTFAFIALPALFSSYMFKKNIQLFIIILAIILSFSIGAWIFLIISVISLFLYKLLREKKIIKRLLLFMLLTFTLIILSGIINSSEFLIDYLSTKFASDYAAGEGSFGGRYFVAVKTFSVLSESPFGFGAGSTSILNMRSNIGWINCLLDSGVIGGIFYFLSFSVLIFSAIKSLLSSNDIYIKIYAIAFLAACFGALQRTPVDGSLWHWWIIIGYLRLSRYDLYDKRKYAGVNV